MNTSRVIDIIESSDTIEVLYNGIPVWLESVGSDNMVAVTNLKTRTSDTVPANQLFEKNQ